MSVDITCPSCGLECERVRVGEDTFSHECPECDYTESLIRLFPLAVLELLQYLLIFLASLPVRIARWLYRRATNVRTRLTPDATGVESR